jgi:hypothetical protein
VFGCGYRDGVMRPNVEVWDCKVRVVKGGSVMALGLRERSGERDSVGEDGLGDGLWIVYERN